MEDSFSVLVTQIESVKGWKQPSPHYTGPSVRKQDKEVEVGRCKKKGTIEDDARSGRDIKASTFWSNFTLMMHRMIGEKVEVSLRLFDIYIGILFHLSY